LAVLGRMVSGIARYLLYLPLKRDSGLSRYRFSSRPCEGFFSWLFVVRLPAASTFGDEKVVEFAMLPIMTGS